MFKMHILPLLTAFLYRFYFKLLHIIEINRDKVDALQKQNGKLIFAHWHGEQFALVGLWAHTRMAVLASLSQDGSFQAKLLTLLGYDVVRGSSSRGGVVALLKLIEHIRLNLSNAALAVDGPRGPIHKVKPGIVLLAKKTNSVIIPAIVISKKKLVFKKSWCKYFIPLPFSKVIVIYGDPIASGHAKEEIEATVIDLEKALHELNKSGEKMIA